ncbi:MAG: 5'-nucleotidase C-terminal domain-containing protein [Pseudomonadota bacterium]
MVVGLTLDDPVIVNEPENSSELVIRGPRPEAESLGSDFDKKGNAGVVITLARSAHESDAATNTRTTADAALVRFLESGALDLVVSSYPQGSPCVSNERLVHYSFRSSNPCRPQKANGTWIVQTPNARDYISRIDLVIRDGELEVEHYYVIPVSPEVQSAAESMQDGVRIGTTISRLNGEREKVRFGQTNLGHLIASAYAAEVGADLAVVPSGGIRDSIELEDIWLRDLLRVQPFGNRVTCIDMTGAEVIDYLNGIAAMPVGTGAYAQYAGVNMVLTPDGVRDVLLNGKPVRLLDTYRFTVPSCNAAGGDGYPKLVDHPGFVDTGVFV